MFIFSVIFSSKRKTVLAFLVLVVKRLWYVCLYDAGYALFKNKEIIFLLFNFKTYEKFGMIRAINLVGIKTQLNRFDFLGLFIF